MLCLFGWCLYWRSEGSVQPPWRDEEKRDLERREREGETQPATGWFNCNELLRWQAGAWKCRDQQIVCTSVDLDVSKHLLSRATVQHGLGPRRPFNHHLRQQGWCLRDRSMWLFLAVLLLHRVYFLPGWPSHSNVYLHCAPQQHAFILCVQQNFTKWNNTKYENWFFLHIHQPFDT